MTIASLLAKIPMWAWILAAALCVIGVQQWRLTLANHRAAAFQSAVATFQSSQATNLTTIHTLQGVSAEWASKCAANEPEARQQAQASVTGDAKRHAQADAIVNNLRYQVQHDAIVKSWFDVPVPVVAFDSLRKNGSTD